MWAGSIRPSDGRRGTDWLRPRRLHPVAAFLRMIGGVPDNRPRADADIAPLRWTRDSHHAFANDLAGRGTPASLGMWSRGWHVASADGGIGIERNADQAESQQSRLTESAIGSRTAKGRVSGAFASPRS